MEGGDDVVDEGAGDSCDEDEEVADTSEDAQEMPEGDARPSLSSDGAGVAGGESGMEGMGWSLKQADS